MKLLDFLFGKKPDIFNPEGEVRHQLDENRWAEWKDRFNEEEEYDWTKHSGSRYRPPSFSLRSSSSANQE